VALVVQVVAPLVVTVVHTLAEPVLVGKDMLVVAMAVSLVHILVAQVAEQAGLVEMLYRQLCLALVASEHHQVLLELQHITLVAVVVGYGLVVEHLVLAATVAAVQVGYILIMVLRVLQILAVAEVVRDTLLVLAILVVMVVAGL
jgi:hypothetical protein